MKVFVFLRGNETPQKKQIAQEIMKRMNPDLNTVRAICVSLNDYLPNTGQISKAERRAADRSCKNLVKRLLGGSHNEQFVVINNESLQPTHWQSFYALADGISVNAVGVGININNSSDTEQKNLEDRNLQVFKASMYKYYEVENLDDVESVVNDILSKLEPKT